MAFGGEQERLEHDRPCRPSSPPGASRRAARAAGKPPGGEIVGETQRRPDRRRVAAGDGAAGFAHQIIEVGLQQRRVGRGIGAVRRGVRRRRSARAAAAAGVGASRRPGRAAFGRVLPPSAVAPGAASAKLAASDGAARQDRRSHRSPSLALRADSHIRVIRAAAAFGRRPVYILTWVLDVACFAVDAVLRVDLEARIGPVVVIKHFIHASGAISCRRFGVIAED